MHGIPVLLSLAAAAACLASPPGAWAGVPSPANCTLPAIVVLVGQGPAGADSAAGHFEIVVRDFANNPIGWATVILDFPDYAEFQLGADQRDPRLHVLCANRSLYTQADASGTAHFTLIGGGRAPLGAPRSNRALRVAINGSPLVTLPCASFDMDGMNGVALTDLQYWARDFFGIQHPTRADFDGDRVVTLMDLSRWASAFFGGGSPLSAPAYCP